MNFDNILFETINNIGKITLNRPSVINSFNMPMAREMQKALDICAENDEIRAILITGAGKGFCAGQDLAEAIGVDAPPIEKIVNETYNPIIERIRGIEKPVICAVNGVAAGAGANIAIACDITIACDSSSFIQAFSKIGLIPDSAGTFFLPRLIGFQKATALMFLADKISGKDAADMGMIYKAVSDDQLIPEALKIAGYLAQMPTRAFGLTKKALNESLNNNLEDQLKVEARLQAEAASSYDFKEGVKAFIEKRKPDFKGK